MTSIAIKDVSRIIGGTIVNNDHFSIRVCLGKRAFDRSGQEATVVVAIDNDTCARHARHDANLIYLPYAKRQHALAMRRAGRDGKWRHSHCVPNSSPTAPGVWQTLDTHRTTRMLASRSRSIALLAAEQLRTDQ